MANKPLAVTLTVITVTFTLFMCNKSCEKSKIEEANKPKVYKSEYDGSVSQVERYLEHTLKDPDSYQGIEWSQLSNYGTYFIVNHKYRARNSFGGYVIEQQTFCLDSIGNIVDVK